MDFQSPSPVFWPLPPIVDVTTLTIRLQMTLTLSSIRVAIPLNKMLNQMLSRSTFEIFTTQEK